MAVAPEIVHDYYRRAASLVRKQATDSTVSLPEPTSSIASSSSATSASTASTTSTQSSSSQSSQTSRPTAPTNQPTATVPPTSNSIVTSDVSSMFSSQYVTTNSSGQVVTTTLVIVPTGSTTEASSSSPPPIGAIIGGVVGGIAVIALIGLGIFLIRRKMKRDEFEANIFDPDRNVERPTSTGAGPRFDLGDAGGGATGLGAGATGMAAVDSAGHVTPYSYGPTSTGPTSTNHGSSVIGQPEMQQAPNTGYYPDPYGQHQYSQYPTNPLHPNTAQYSTAPVGVGEHFPNPYAPGYHPSAAIAGGALGAGMAAHGVSRGQTMSSVSSGYPSPSPGFSGHSQDGMSQSTSPPTVAGAGAYVAQNSRSAKEREAFARTNQHQQYSVANQSDQRNLSPTPSANHSSVVGSSVVGPTSPVMVHQDGGRIREDEGGNEEAEIPPTYDSIPRGH